MPDAFGNQTPQDIFAQVSANRQFRMANATNATERRLANVASLGEAFRMGIDPRLLKSKEIEAALNTGLTRGTDEDALDFQVRNLRKMQDNVFSIDPTTAAEISSQLTVLEEERVQRAVLRQKEEDRVELHQASIEQKKDEDRERDSPAVNSQLALDPATLRIIPNSSILLTDPDFDKTVQEINENNPKDQ